MPEGIQFTAHPHWENFIDAWNMQHHPAAAQQLHSGDRGRALRGDLLLARRLCLRSAQGAVQGPDYVLFLVGLTIPFETFVTPLYYEISGMGLLKYPSCPDPAAHRPEYSVRYCVDALLLRADAA